MERRNSASRGVCVGEGAGYRLGTGRASGQGKGIEKFGSAHQQPTGIAQCQDGVLR